MLLLMTILISAEEPSVELSLNVARAIGSICSVASTHPEGALARASSELVLEMASTIELAIRNRLSVTNENDELCRLALWNCAAIAAIGPLTDECSTAVLVAALPLLAEPWPQCPVSDDPIESTVNHVVELLVAITCTGRRDSAAMCEQLQLICAHTAPLCAAKDVRTRVRVLRAICQVIAEVCTKMRDQLGDLPVSTAASAALPASLCSALLISLLPQLGGTHRMIVASAAHAVVGVLRMNRGGQDVDGSDQWLSVLGSDSFSTHAQTAAAQQQLIRACAMIIDAREITAVLISLAEDTYTRADDDDGGGASLAAAVAMAVLIDARGAVLFEEKEKEITCIPPENHHLSRIVETIVAKMERERERASVQLALLAALRGLCLAGNADSFQFVTNAVLALPLPLSPIALRVVGMVSGAEADDISAAVPPSDPDKVKAMMSEEALMALLTKQLTSTNTYYAAAPAATDCDDAAGSSPGGASSGGNSASTTMAVRRGNALVAAQRAMAALLVAPRCNMRCNMRCTTPTATATSGLDVVEIVCSQLITIGAAAAAASSFTNVVFSVELASIAVELASATADSMRALVKCAGLTALLTALEAKPLNGVGDSVLARLALGSPSDSLSCGEAIDEAARLLCKHCKRGGAVEAHAAAAVFLAGSDTGEGHRCAAVAISSAALLYLVTTSDPPGATTPSLSSSSSSASSSLQQQRDEIAVVLTQLVTCASEASSSPRVRVLVMQGLGRLVSTWHAYLDPFVPTLMGAAVLASANDEVAAVQLAALQMLADLSVLPVAAPHIADALPPSVCSLLFRCFWGRGCGSSSGSSSSSAAGSSPAERREGTDGDVAETEAAYAARTMMIEKSISAVGADDAFIRAATLRLVAVLFHVAHRRRAALPELQTRFASEALRLIPVAVAHLRTPSRAVSITALLCLCHAARLHLGDDVATRAVLDAFANVGVVVDRPTMRSVLEIGWRAACCDEKRHPLAVVDSHDFDALLAALAPVLLAPTKSVGEANLAQFVRLIEGGGHGGGLGLGSANCAQWSTVRANAANAAAVVATAGTAFGVEGGTLGKVSGVVKILSKLLGDDAALVRSRAAHSLAVVVTQLSAPSETVAL